MAASPSLCKAEFNELAVVVKTDGIPCWLGLVNSPPILGYLF